jgi:hypothetical protein
MRCCRSRHSLSVQIHAARTVLLGDALKEAQAGPIEAPRVHILRGRSVHGADGSLGEGDRSGPKPNGGT